MKLRGRLARLALLVALLAVAAAPAAQAQEGVVAKYKEAVAALDRGASGVAKLLIQEGIGLAQRSGDAIALEQGQKALDALEKGDEVGAKDYLTEAIASSSRETTEVPATTATTVSAGVTEGGERAPTKEIAGSAEGKAEAEKMPQTDAGPPVFALAGLGLMLLGTILLTSRRLALRRAR